MSWVLVGWDQKEPVACREVLQLQKLLRSVPLKNVRKNIPDSSLISRSAPKVKGLFFYIKVLWNSDKYFFFVIPLKNRNKGCRWRHILYEPPYLGGGIKVMKRRNWNHGWNKKKQNLINCLKWRHSRSDTLLFFISISAALTDKIQLIITLCLFLPRQSFAQRGGGGGGGGGGWGGGLWWMDETEKLFAYNRVKVPTLSFAEHPVCSTTDTETRTTSFFRRTQTEMKRAELRLHNVDRRMTFTWGFRTVLIFSLLVLCQRMCC